MTVSTRSESEAHLNARSSLIRSAGWSDSSAAPLAGDASARRYERLRRGSGDETAVLMIAPGGGDTRRFTAMTSHLRALGFSAPEIVAADHDAGLLLLEDLGDALFARVAKDRPELEGPLYERAIDLLLALRDTPPPRHLVEDGHRIEIPDYDAQFLNFEAALFHEWWLPAACGVVSSDAVAEFDALVATACAAVAETRDALVLRDYHAENLIWRPERPKLGAVGLLDYQDARRGHPAYDVISLLEDARRNLGDGLSDCMLARYASTLAPSDRTEFEHACAILGAQRNLKIIGIFARLWLRDGKPGYLDLIPRVWRHLRHDLSHPTLRGLDTWVQTHSPEPTDEVLAKVRAERGGGL